MCGPTSFRRRGCRCADSKASRITAIATGPLGLTRTIPRPWCLWCAAPMTWWSLSQEAMAGIPPGWQDGGSPGAARGRSRRGVRVAQYSMSEIKASISTRKHCMATHQALSGVTDEAFLQRMVQSHAERYGEAFWDFFATHVAPRLPPRPIIVDLGCGPGLFVQALNERYPQATLYGYDVTP